MECCTYTFLSKTTYRVLWYFYIFIFSYIKARETSGDDRQGIASSWEEFSGECVAWFVHRVGTMNQVN